MNTIPAGYKLSDKAKKFTNSYGAFINNGWNKARMIHEGMLELIQPDNHIIPAGYKMSAKADGAEYVDFMNAGWTEEEMIDIGYIELIHIRNTVADAWEHFGGVWPWARHCAGVVGVNSDGSITRAQPNSIIANEECGTYMICTLEQFESYGRNRKVEAFKSPNAMVDKFEAAKQRYMEKQQSKELKKQELAHIVKNTAIKQLQTGLSNARGNYVAARKEARLHQSVVTEQRDEIAGLKAMNENASESNGQLQEELKELGIGNREQARAINKLNAANELLLQDRKKLIESNRDQALEIRGLKIEIREQAIEIRELDETFQVMPIDFDASNLILKEPKNDD
jgi:hypothetical protein